MINNTIIRFLDIQNGLNEPFNAIEQDNNSRFLTIYLTNGNIPQDLTGCQVFLQTSFTTTLGNSNIENEGQIIDEVNGIIKLEITSSMIPKCNYNQAFQVAIRKVNDVYNNDRLTFPKFIIKIAERVINANGEDTILAVNESTVVDGLNAVNVNLQETIDEIGTATDGDTTLTLFGKMNGIKKVVGISDPTTANTATVMNYLKKIDTYLATSGIGGNVIKSIQHIRFDLSTMSNSTNFYILINAVNVNKSFITLGSSLSVYTTTGTSLNMSKMISISLYDSTRVRLNNNIDSIMLTSMALFAFSVVEFN